MATYMIIRFNRDEGCVKEQNVAVYEDPTNYTQEVLEDAGYINDYNLNLCLTNEETVALLLETLEG